MSGTLEVNDRVLEAEIVAGDRQLEVQADLGNKPLMQYRWHWTLDESNPKRMSLRAYAKLVDRAFSTIKAYAKGYERWLTLSRNERINTLTPTEALIRANMSEDTEAATEAVAMARQVSFDTVHQRYRPEVRKVRAKARQQAKDKGTTVKDEAPQVAQQTLQEKEEEIKQQRDAIQQLKKELKAAKNVPAGLSKKVADLQQKLQQAQKQSAERDNEIKRLEKQVTTANERKAELEDYILNSGGIRRSKTIDRFIVMGGRVLGVDPKVAVHEFTVSFGVKSVLSNHYNLIQYIIPWLETYAEEIKRTVGAIEEPPKKIEGEVVPLSVAEGLRKRRERGKE